MSELRVGACLTTPRIDIRDVHCSGTCRHKSASEQSEATHLVFTYSGLFARHVGEHEAIGDANQVMFFNAAEEYRVSHPISGGDSCLSLSVADSWLEELVPPGEIDRSSVLRFRGSQKTINGQTQRQVIELKQKLSRGSPDSFEIESLALALAASAVGGREAWGAGYRLGQHKTVNRAKVLLASDPTRRWSLAEIGAEVGVSPVYLTQLFQKVCGEPLYRYHLRLRLARAMRCLTHCDDLTGLALDFGFSSHSHFTTAFRTAFGQTPTSFRRASRLNASN